MVALKVNIDKMKNSYFLQLENIDKPLSIDLEEAIKHLAYNSQGLIPVVTQEHKTKDVLMLAWMNQDALRKTLSTGCVTYWSRSRQQFWVKGQTSGNTQQLVSLSIDCDGDAILCQVKQLGAACHTGRGDCFYLTVDRETKKVLVPAKHT